MFERQLADLPVDPCPVDRDRLLGRAEGRDDRRHGHVIERDAGYLGEHRALPRRIAEGAELQAEVDVLRSQYQALVKRAGGGELVASGTKTKRLVAPASNPARIIGSPSACA